MADDNISVELQIALDNLEEFNSAEGATILDFSGLKLTTEQLSSLLAQISDPSKLTTLYLSNNQMNALPEALMAFDGLFYLDCSQNQISQLPETIDRLLLLKDLDLSDNQILELPENLGKIGGLEELNINGNPITKLPKAMENLVWLSGFEYNNEKITEVSAEIGKLHRLEQAIKDSLKNGAGEVDLSEQNLTAAQLKGLVPVLLSVKQQIFTLVLSNNHLDSLPLPIEDFENLSDIDLSHNPIAKEEKKFRDRIIGNNPVKKLNYRYKTSFDEDLGTLDLSGLQFNETDLKEIRPVLEIIKNDITELDLSNNEISTLPIDLKDFSKLVILDLEDNPIRQSAKDAIRENVSDTVQVYLPNSTIVEITDPERIMLDGKMTTASNLGKRQTSNSEEQGPNDADNHIAPVAKRSKKTSIGIS